jgi:hypothetical protein
MQVILQQRPRKEKWEEDKRIKAQEGRNRWKMDSFLIIYGYGINFTEFSINTEDCTYASEMRRRCRHHVGRRARHSATVEEVMVFNIASTQYR